MNTSAAKLPTRKPPRAPRLTFAGQWVLPAQGVAIYDKACEQQLLLPVELLMEHAGALVAQYAAHLVQSLQPAHRIRILVLAGPGNNGGDACVAARLLAAQGLDVAVHAVVPLKDCSPLLRQQHARALAAGVRKHASLTAATLRNYAIVIDGMFGAGLTRPLQAKALHAATLLRAAKHHPLVLAIDLPSGMHATTGKAITTRAQPAICVQATLTLALTALKPAMLTLAGQAACGVICIEKLPIPTAMHNRLMKQCGGYIAT